MRTVMVAVRDTAPFSFSTQTEMVWAEPFSQAVGMAMPPVSARAFAPSVVPWVSRSCTGASATSMS